MKKIVLLIVFLLAGAYAVNTTRYWDACKPSCGWTGNASGSPNGVAKSCSVNGSVLGDDGARNACEGGGTAYTCMKQAPWKVSDNLSYGFAASHTNGDCGKCFELSFNNGKKMVIMVSNIGGDVGQNQFDLMIPGGGVGAFNALSNQISQNGGSSSNLGAQYGGFRQTCGPNKDCIRNMCNSAFGSAALADLKAGCDWYIDWFDAADNPTANSQSVTCPQALIDKYKGNFSNSNPTPTPTPSSSSNNNSGGGISSNSSGGGSNCGSVVTASTETTKIEAECYLSKNGANMKTESANGVTSIGYIENGYSTTYKVSIPSGRAGQYTMRFRIATEMQSNFTVKVNNNNVGRIDQGNTGNWNTYIDKELSSKAQFNNGENTIVLEFGSPINVDYFLIIGGGPSPSSSSAASSSSSAPRSSSSSSSLSLSSSSSSSSSSSEDAVFIRQIPNAITLESLANNTTIEVYNLQSKRIYFGNSENSKNLQIPVQTKGMYIVRIKSGSEIKLLRVPVM
ncbi:MAG: carbohydrate-binding protein [Fibromonadales bacterium]|nr:carbohydrate-binding protein [Fibromonadales bacterium]